MINIKRLPKYKIKEQILILILILIISLSVVYIYHKIDVQNETSYAYTISLGNGFGFTVYTASFYKLDPLLQESIIVHEKDHLKSGTFSLSNTTEALHELHAYDVQLEWLDNKAEELKQLFKKTRNNEYLEKYVLVRTFWLDSKDIREQYAKRLLSASNK